MITLMISDSEWPLAPEAYTQLAQCIPTSYKQLVLPEVPQHVRDAVLVGAREREEWLWVEFGGM